MISGLKKEIKINIQFQEFMGVEFSDTSMLKLYGKLILEEGEELRDYVSKVDLRNALCDVFTLAVAIRHAAGTSVDEMTARPSDKFRSHNDIYQFTESIHALTKSGKVREARNAATFVMNAIVKFYECEFKDSSLLVSDLSVVNESNMSKFVTEDDYYSTMEKYRKIGIGLWFKDVSPSLDACFSKGGMGTDGKYYPKNKLLKSVAFFEPQFIDVPR